MEKKLLIECSEGSLDAIVGTCDSVLESVEFLKEIVMRQYGITLEVLIYDGMDSLYGGGRKFSRKPKVVMEFADYLNDYGISLHLKDTLGFSPSCSPFLRKLFLTF